MKNAKDADTKRATRLTRRKFVKTTSTALAAGVGFGLFGGRPPAYAQRRTVHTLQWAHFIPPADEELRRQAKEFEKASGVKMKMEFINLNDITPRATAAIEGGIGPDIFNLQWNQAHLFAAGLDNHDDLMDEIGEEDVYPSIVASIKVNGVYRGIPFMNIGWAPTYRKDIFKQAGAKVPDTWDEYLVSGRKLKKFGYPVGQTLGHTIGDAPFFVYSLLWTFGGMETDKDQRVIIDSKETRRSIEFLKEFWFAACDESGMAWDDGSNNRAFLGETISVTGNAISIYFKARHSPGSVPVGMADNIGHFLPPAGPAGRYNMTQPYNHCIMKQSKNKEAAREYLRFIMQEDNHDRWFRTQEGFHVGYSPRFENHPMWDEDPAVSVFRDIAKYSRSMGYAGPNDRKSSEVQAKYIIVDMYARAVRGDSPAAATAWAEKELKIVYGG